MQLQKDVLIAGGVVVVCVALVIVALVATGKKDAPADPVASSAPGDTYNSSSYNSSSYGDPSSFSTPASTPSGTLPSDSYGSYNPAPVSSSTPGSSAFAPVDGPSAFAPPTASTSSFDSGMGAPAPTSGFSDPVTAPATPTVSTGTPAGTHTVAKGETLGDISATHYGTTKHWRKIVEANPGLDPARLKIGQVLQIPAVESAPAATATVGGPDTYTVKKGESYYTIAKKALGSSSRWREIERLNNIPAEDLRAGTVIKLPAKESGGAGPAANGAAPVGGGKTHVVAKGETLGDISKIYFGTTTKWKQIVEANAGVRPENLKVGQSLVIPDLPTVSTAPASVSAPVGGSTYTVKSGDTLESIAASTLGKKTAWKQIVEVNPGLQPTSLRIGQVLAIPGGSAAPVVPTVPAVDGGFAPMPGSPAPAPIAPPAPTFQDDPFYSPYDAQPAPAPVRSGV